ncbi:single-stranded DNA-binding protein [candidate division SR1 bacterium]|nr:single-stranded DNA-binding protein [candidate division SR1 bacterium]
MDLNKVMLIGRATNNLQVKTIETTGTPVVNFTVATNRKYKNKDGNVMEDAEYHRCVAYGNGADVLGKYLIKGKRVYIEGRLRTRRRTDSEGIEKFSTEIIVDNFIFLDSRSDGNIDKSSDEGFDTPISPVEDVFNDDISTEEIPF